MGGPWISWEALAWKGSGVQLLLCLLFFTGSATFVIRDGGGQLVAQDDKRKSAIQVHSNGQAWSLGGWAIVHTGGVSMQRTMTCLCAAHRINFVKCII